MPLGTMSRCLRLVLAWHSKPNHTRLCTFPVFPLAAPAARHHTSPAAAGYIPASYSPLSGVSCTPTLPITFRIEQGFDMAPRPQFGPGLPSNLSSLPLIPFTPGILDFFQFYTYSVFPLLSKSLSTVLFCFLPRASFLPFFI